MTASAFGTIPSVGPAVLTFGLISFVFSTLIGWSYYGEKSLEYLGGLRFVPVYRWLWVVAIFLGATFPSSLVINFSDSANALMAIPKLISLIALAGLAARESKDLLSQPKPSSEGMGRLPVIGQSRSARRPWRRTLITVRSPRYSRPQQLDDVTPSLLACRLRLAYQPGLAYRLRLAYQPRLAALAAAWQCQPPARRDWP